MPKLTNPIAGEVGSILWLIEQLKKLPQDSFIISIGEFGYIKDDPFNNEITIKLYIPDGDKKNV